MKLWEAIKALEEGKKVKKKDFHDDYYIYKAEYGFIRDEIAIKANMRLDIKKALGEALVIGTSSAVGRSKSKVA